MTATQTAAPATVLSSQQIDFISEVNGQAYRIEVAAPFAPPPAEGYPVLYVLDGAAYFAGYSVAARMRSMSGELAAAIVVGVSYPDEGLLPMLRRRMYDLSATPPTPEEAEVVAGAALDAPVRYAGGGEFIEVIEREIKPRIAALFPVDAGRSALFGHSLGGLFVLQTLFTRPEAFGTYLAVSPSIWWNDRAILKDEAAYRERVADGSVAAPKLFVSVGALEQTPPKVTPPGMTPAVAAEHVARGRMVDNAADLSERLAKASNGEGRVVHHTFEGETHNSVPWRSLNAALDFALG